jgi:DNA-directed RNA polymerase specialized sigma24 family protein
LQGSWVVFVHPSRVKGTDNAESRKLNPHSSVLITQSSVLVMSNHTQTKKPWVLDQQAFDQLLHRLHPEPDQAARIYETLRKKMIAFFEWRGCLYPEEYTDRALDRLAKRIQDGVVVDDIQKFAAGVAHNVLMEYWKEIQPTVQSEEIPLPDSNPVGVQAAEKAKSELREECLSECLNKLPSNARGLIAQYYQNEKAEQIKKRKEMSDSQNISSNALRIRVLRIRVKLQECIEMCMDHKARMREN